jgi:Tetratricopeptide repeat
MLRGLLKKTNRLRCAQTPRYNVLPLYASARRFFARLASEIFLSSLRRMSLRKLLKCSSEMRERRKIDVKAVLALIGLSLSIGAGSSCAPRQVYRAPMPPPSRAPEPSPAPQPLPPAVQESVRKPLPEDPQIQEQNLPSTAGRSERILKEPPTAPPAAPSAPPELAAPLPDDSSLLAKITASTLPQRAASLRLTDEGRKLIDGGAPGKGLPRLEQSIAIDSTNPYSYFFLAKAHHKLGRHKESLSFLDVAESRLAGEAYWLAEVYALKGENFRALGMAERAEANYTKALSINPGNRTAVEAASAVQSGPAAAPR